VFFWRDFYGELRGVGSSSFLEEFDVTRGEFGGLLWKVSLQLRACLWYLKGDFV